MDDLTKAITAILIVVIIGLAAYYGYQYWKKHHKGGFCGAGAGACPCGCPVGCSCAAGCRCRRSGHCPHI